MGAALAWTSAAAQGNVASRFQSAGCCSLTAQLCRRKMTMPCSYAGSYCSSPAQQPSHHTQPSGEHSTGQHSICSRRPANADVASGCGVTHPRPSASPAAAPSAKPWLPCGGLALPSDGIRQGQHAPPLCAELQLWQLMMRAARRRRPSAPIQSSGTGYPGIRIPKFSFWVHFSLKTGTIDVRPRYRASGKLF
eukprot:SAG31_NODE_2960_length_4850_cov_5.261840_1_plen_193_part_00